MCRLNIALGILKKESPPQLQPLPKSSECPKEEHLEITEARQNATTKLHALFPKDSLRQLDGSLVSCSQAVGGGVLSPRRPTLQVDSE